MTYSLDDDEYGDHTEKDMNMADETDGADPERRTHLNELQLKINEALKNYPPSTGKSLCFMM